MANCRFDIPSYNDIGCDFETGRVVAFALVDEDKADSASVADWSDPTFWNTEDYASDILIHQKTNGTYTATAVTVAGKGTQGERLAGMDHAAQMRVEGLNNSSYWDDLNRSDNYRIVLVTDNYNKILVSQTNVNIIAKLDIQDDTNSVVDWVVDATWKTPLNPEVYDAPSGIFN